MWHLKPSRKKKTIQQIAIDEDVAAAQVSAWKKDLQERIGELFERKNAASESIKKSEAQTARLERKVGQLVIEKEFLEKKCVQLGIDLSERP